MLVILQSGQQFSVARDTTRAKRPDIRSSKDFRSGDGVLRHIIGDGSETTLRTEDHANTADVGVVCGWIAHGRLDRDPAVPVPSTESEEVAAMASPTMGIEQHPDIVALRSRYEQAAENWVSHIVTGLVLLTGLYLALSPWVVGFQTLTPLAITNFMTGTVMMVLAFGLSAAYGRWHGLAWVLPVLGAWTFVAPWVIRADVNTTPAVTNNVAVGAIFTALGLASLYLSTARYGVDRLGR